MYPVIKNARTLELPIDMQLYLFDTMVLPVATYGCEVWGYKSLDVIEKIRLKFLKYLLRNRLTHFSYLRVKSSTPSCMVYWEPRRFPFSIHIKTRYRLISSGNPDKLSVKMYNMLYDCYTHKRYVSDWLSWLSSFSEIGLLINIGFGYIWYSQVIIGPTHQLSEYSNQMSSLRYLGHSTEWWVMTFVHDQCHVCITR